MKNDDIFQCLEIFFFVRSTKILRVINIKMNIQTMKLFHYLFVRK